MEDWQTILLSGGVALIGAVVGSVVTARLQERSTVTTFKLQREAQLEDRLLTHREQHYSRLLQQVRLVVLWMQRTVPMIEPCPEPPTLPGDEQAIELMAGIVVYASPEIRALIERWTAAGWKFENAHGVFLTAPAHSDEERAVHVEIENARAEAHAIATEMEQRVAEELAAEPAP